ncbi:MAG: 2-hydroxyacid dehydrogenase [Clostridium sp.]|uniref:2-hydroxyacid dehydrogenase n=1 Tax=Clostridium sp. TaxID=1506 RepID=UPI0025B7AF7E|nr:2-hydroxyacid dehydrogenase [Clostridium sp.]MCH3965968.1 2-hydroxyacid dehydrogenase [Clostridium sp.]MCI1715944.1 2-hydroxyacid dehydrogenase [Clostridium sp.]MCI1800384.1 2-hydroxyacid dehydrogenase [Clostridium sp.]MCI1814121.1 2-hydroxyacid dehydrogenase [Clostridium sp.]MCI1871019.1 2-hydroxyacid dehydrogenase [Clostridium sp.]
MKISVIEPLGLSEDELRNIAKPITDRGHELVIYNNKVTDTGILKERVRDSEVIVLANMPLKGEVIATDDKLKMISIAFTGVDHVELKACGKNVVVSNAAGYSTDSVAELAIGLTLSLLRNIVPLDRSTREGKTKDGYSQRDLSGKTFGVIGTGAIGSAVCRLAKAFGCSVLAYNRSRKQELESIGIKYVTLDELLSKSDVVSVHLPQNDDTKGLISSEKIALMKESALLINAARGPIVDNAALAQALKAGKLGGAGIDVFDSEPPLEDIYPLLDAPNTVLTPHIGFATKEAMVRRAHITFENIIKWLDGQPQNLVKF